MNGGGLLPYSLKCVEVEFSEVQDIQVIRLASPKQWVGQK
jgi:hypothetical protein